MTPPTAALPLKAWLKEREANCLRIANTKTSSDKAGWLEDASYFSQCIELLSRAPAAQETTETDGQEINPVRDALAHADDWISHQEHGDNCFLTNDPPEYNVCQCGKESALDAIERAQDALDAPPAAQEQKPVATPVAWIRGHEYLVDGEREYDEEVSAGASKPNGERWHPLFASPTQASGWVMVPEELLGMEFSVAQGDALRRTDPSGRLNLNSTAAWLVSGKVRNAIKGRQLAEALTKLLAAPGETK